MPSIIAEIGEIIERHLTIIGMIKKPELDEHQKKLIEEKKAELQAESQSTASGANSEEAWMANATMCVKCNQKSVVVRDGCQTCMNCGDSKCS